MYNYHFSFLCVNLAGVQLISFNTFLSNAHNSQQLLSCSISANFKPVEISTAANFLLQGERVLQSNPKSKET